MKLDAKPSKTAPSAPQRGGASQTPPKDAFSDQNPSLALSCRICKRTLNVQDRDDGHGLLCPACREKRRYPPRTLDEAKAAITKWLHITDEDVLEIIFAFSLSEKLPGDPLWLFLIAPPGGCKTEILRAMDGRDYYHLSDLTAKTFVSGLMLGKGDERRKIDDLLPQLHQKLLIFKDFTTVLEKNRDERQEIIAQLREIYDGSYAKKFGTMDRKVRYTSRFGLLAGVTPIIDRHWKLMQQLGERFLKYRWDEDADATTRRAQRNEGDEAMMRAEIHDAVMGFLLHLEVPESVAFGEELLEPLILAAKFLADLRTPVSIHAGQSDFYYDFIPTPERPTRLVKQLKKLCKALAVVRGRDRVTREDLLVAVKVAFSTAPQDRLAVLRAVQQHQTASIDGCTVAQIKKDVQLPESSIRNIVQQLVILRLLYEQDVTRQRDGFRESVRYYRLSKTVPALSPPTLLEASNNAQGDSAGGRAQQEQPLARFLNHAENGKVYETSAVATLCEVSSEVAEAELRRLAEGGEVFQPRPGLWGVLK